MSHHHVRGRLVTGDGDVPDAVIEIADGRIVAVRRLPSGPDTSPRDAALEHRGRLTPGLVDIHCHGGGGASFAAGSIEQARQAALAHHQWGTTSLLGSAVSDGPQQLLGTVSTLAQAVDEGLIEGIHIEGPYLAQERCGAQDPQALRIPDVAEARELLRAGGGHVRQMTIAPELPGAPDVAQILAEQGAVAAVGHTAADAHVTARALRHSQELLGRSLVTHLFNGMPTLHHRAVGPAGAALEAASQVATTLELIADGVHVDQGWAATLLRLLPGQIALVSDAMAAAGMADGHYQLGPAAVSVQAGVARLRDGDSIAGGTSCLAQQVRGLIAAGVNPSQVIAAATTTPAAVTRLDGSVGSLSPGSRADVLVWDEDWRVTDVMRQGEWLDRAP